MATITIPVAARFEQANGAGFDSDLIHVACAGSDDTLALVATHDTRKPVLDCLSSIPLPLLVLDQHGNRVFENPAFRTRFEGQAGEELEVALLAGARSARRAAQRGIS